MSGIPRVSVIMIFLNAAVFITEAIASVLAQQYADWELLLVDDGSTDASTRIAQDFAAAYPAKIRYLEHSGHQNLGMSVSRNLGLQASRGAYIAFLDADDIWLPTKLAYQVPLLDQHPDVVMVYGSTMYWYSWMKDAHHPANDYVYRTRVENNAVLRPPELLRCYLSNQAAVPCMCSVLARRTALQHVQGFEASFRGLYEDQVFYAKMCLAGPILVTDQFHEYYRQHPQSTCAIAEREGRVRAAQHMYLDWLAMYLRQRKCRNVALWYAWRMAKWQAMYPALHRASRAIRRRWRRWRTYAAAFHRPQWR